MACALQGKQGASKFARSKGQETVPIEYWCFVPNAVDLLPEQRRAEGGKLKAEGQKSSPPPQSPSFVVYYCVDDWSGFHNLDTAWMESKEGELLKRADMVFTPANYLVEKCRRIIADAAGTAATTGGEGKRGNSRRGACVHYFPHGVEYAKFRAALTGKLSVPEDIAGLPRPVIGFYGNIYPWIDFELVKSLAVSRRNWSFVLIGQEYCDVSGLRALGNVHFLGRRAHDALPSYCAAFSAAIIPYDVNDPRMESVNPVKTRELLAAGVPIAAADLPELRGYGDRVRICRTVDEWIDALERQIARTDRDAISRSVAGDDWSVRVADIRRIVDRAGQPEDGDGGQKTET